MFELMPFINLGNKQPFVPVNQ